MTLSPRLGVGEHNRPPHYWGKQTDVPRTAALLIFQVGSWLGRDSWRRSHPPAIGRPSPIVRLLTCNGVAAFSVGFPP